MPALGGPARRIVERGNFPSWTPDGSAVLYVHGSVSQRPHRAHSGRRAERAGTFRSRSSSSARYFFPRLSDDGRWLLYQNGNQIEVVAAAGGKPKVLAVGQYPAWGAGSTTVLYTNGASGQRAASLWRAPFSLAKGELSGRSAAAHLRPRSTTSAPRRRATARSIAFAALDQSLDLEEIPFDAEAGPRRQGPPRGAHAGATIGSDFFDPVARRESRRVRRRARRGLGSVSRRSAGAARRADAGSELLGQQSRLVSGRTKQIAFCENAGRAAPDDSAALWIMNADGTNPRRVTELSRRDGLVSDQKKIIIERGEKPAAARSRFRGDRAVRRCRKCERSSP